MTTPAGERPATLTERVAEEIRAWLGRRRMSQAALARAVGRSEMWMSDRMTGKQPIDLNELEQIAAVLQVGVLDLFPPTPVAVATLEGDHRPKLRPSIPPPAPKAARSARARAVA